MNWKQIYTLATPEERLDLALHMLRRIESQREVVIIDLRRILMRSAFLGIFAMLTLTTAFITIQAEPVLTLPVISAYLIALFFVFMVKPRTSVPVVQTVHYV